MTQNIAKQHERYNIRLFKRMAPVYDYVEFFVSRIREEVARIDLPRGSKILDVACGTGTQSIAFAKRGLSVVGIDLSPDMLARAKKKIKKGYDATFLCHDASHIPYPDSYFDASSISFGLHDMPEEIGLAVLKEMRRATKQSGKIIIVDYHKPENPFSAFIGNKIAKIWESRYYDYFLRVGLRHYTDTVGLEMDSHEARFWGNVQIATLINEK